MYQAVVFVVNPFSSSSLDYVKSKLDEVPRDMAVLILFNFRDCLDSPPLDSETGEPMRAAVWKQHVRRTDHPMHEAKLLVVDISASSSAPIRLRSLWTMHVHTAVRTELRMARPTTQRTCIMSTVPCKYVPSSVT
jgi:hypothetical protein